MSRVIQSNPSTIPHETIMGRSLLAGAVLTLLLAVLPCGTAAAAGEFLAGSLQLEEIVPAETLLFAKCSGVEQLMADRETLDLFKIWAEEEVQAFFAEARESGTQMIKSRGGPMLPFKEYWSLLQGEVALALSPRLTIFHEGASPSIALAADMGNRKDAFLGTLNGLLEMAGHWKQLERGQFEYRGYEIRFIGKPKQRLTVCFTTIENLFVATLNKYFLQDIINCHLDGRITLKDNPSYNRCLAKVGGESVRMFTFANMEPVYDTVRHFCPYEVEEWAGMLGLNKVDGLCLATAIEAGGARDSLYIDCPGEKTGLLRALAPHPVSRERIRQAPPDTLFFVDVVFDPAEVIKVVDQFVKNALPEFYDEMNKSRAMFQYRIGFDLEKEVFGPVGSELTAFMTVPRGGGMAMMIPDIVISLSLDDVDGFAVLVDKLLTMAGDEVVVKESQYNNRSLNRLVFKEMEGIPIAPTFTIEGDRLLLASTPQTMKRYLTWLDEGGPGLDDAPEFKEAMVGVPDNVSMLKYVNMQKLMSLIYQNATPFMGTVFSQSDLPFDVALLPMTETWTQHLSSAASYTVVDEDGILMSGRWFLGIGAASAAAVSVADYMIENDLVRGLLAGHNHHGGGGPVQPQPVAAVAMDKELEVALEFMKDGDYELAEDLLSQWIMTHPTDGNLAQAHRSRGYCRLKLGMNAQAIPDYERLAELSPKNRSLAYYNLTCAYALQGENQPALQYLDKSLEEGFKDIKLMDTDPDLNNIRGEQRFQELRKELAKKLVLDNEAPEKLKKLGYVR